VTTYTIRVGFNGVVSCDCRDFKEQGGACKHIRGALIILEDLRCHGTLIPHIPIPKSLADAQALQSTILTITIRPNKADLPTAQAAQKIEDILREDDTCLEDDVAVEGVDADDDNASVATDASSDSESESDEDEDEDVLEVSPRPSVHLSQRLTLTFRGRRKSVRLKT
jgi:hypothetical protein